MTTSVSNQLHAAEVLQVDVFPIGSAECHVMTTSTSWERVVDPSPIRRHIHLLVHSFGGPVAKNKES